MERTLVLDNGEVVETDPETETWVQDKNPIPVDGHLIVKVDHEGERDSLMDRAVGFENQVRSGHEPPYGLRFDPENKEIDLVRNVGNYGHLRYPQDYNQIFGWLDYHRPEKSTDFYNVAQYYMEKRKEQDGWLSDPVPREQAREVFRRFDNPDIRRDFAGWLLGRLHDLNERAKLLSEEAPDALGDMTNDLNQLKGIVETLIVGGEVID
jgi:hypothetical protein